MPFTQLDRKLQFLPLGLLWGVVAAWFHTHHFLSPWDGYDQVSWLIPIGTIACTCLIATPLCSVMLNRELSSIRWVVNWMITGVASCVGGVATFYLILILWLSLLRPTQFALSSPISFAENLLFGMLVALGFSLVIGKLIAMESAVVALLLAPLSLLARRLIHRRRSVVESAGDSSQSQP